MPPSPSSSVLYRSPVNVEVIRKLQRCIFFQASKWTCACALSVLLIHKMLTSSMGALLSLLRSMHSLVVIETARSENLTSQKYHLRAFGEESDWIDSVIVLSFGCFDLVTA